MIYIPKRIRVGYQKRDDTYTDVLGYVIYYDDKNKLHKLDSWEGWRHKDMEPNDFDNEPTEGFVINKNAGGYRTDWGTRRVVVRVFDPRNWEFEISVGNLLFILENNNSIKGKGLEGTFVYGWEGKDLVLIPTSSPSYKEQKAYADQRASPEKINMKNVVLGATYLTKGNKTLVYLGRHMAYREYKNEQLGLRHFFMDDSEQIRVTSSLSNLMQTISPEPVSNYADLFDKLQKSTQFSPVNKASAQYVPYTYEELAEALKDRMAQWWGQTVTLCIPLDGIDVVYKKYTIKVKRNLEGSLDFDGALRVSIGDSEYCYSELDDMYNLRQFVEKFKPVKRLLFLENGQPFNGYYIGLE
jgi:hypothetical protein